MIELGFWWALLLLPLPLLVYYFVTPQETSNTAIVVPFYQQLSDLQQPESRLGKRSHFSLLILVIVWVLCVLSAARPQWVGEPQALPTSGRDLLLAVDISDSMELEDMELNNRSVSRLVAVKAVVSEFIQRRQGDRIGLILFGTNAYLQAPLTFDTDTVKQFLEDAQLGFAGPKTAIGDAIGLSVKRLKERSQQQLQTQPLSNDNQVIILLTDGANTAGAVKPVQAAELAKQIETKIYTIGIGAEEMMVRRFFSNRRINPSADLDEATLTTIAETTGGQYFRARNIDELENIYQLLDDLEPVSREQEWLRPTRSLFMWPLAMAIIISIIYSVFLSRHQLTTSNKPVA